MFAPAAMSQQQGTIYFAWKKCGIGESNLALSARLSAKMFGFGGSRSATRFEPEKRRPN